MAYFHPILDATEQNNLSLIKDIASSEDISSLTGQMMSFACEDGFLDIVKFLVEEHYVKLDFGVFQYYDDALRSGHIDILNYLLPKNLDPEDLVQGFFTAISLKNTTAIDLFLQHQVSIENSHLTLVFHNSYNETIWKLLNHCDSQKSLDYALWLAAKYDQPDMVDYLLKKGADYHYQNHLALRVSITHNRIDNLKLILNAGANIHYTDDPNLKAINLALSHGHQEMINYLISLGETVSADLFEYVLLSQNFSLIENFIKDYKVDLFSDKKNILIKMMNAFCLDSLHYLFEIYYDHDSELIHELSEDDSLSGKCFDESKIYLKKFIKLQLTKSLDNELPYQLTEEIKSKI